MIINKNHLYQTIEYIKSNKIYLLEKKCPEETRKQKLKSKFKRKKS